MKRGKLVTGRKTNLNYIYVKISELKNKMRVTLEGETGFSIMELLVVITLTGIIVAVVTPAFNRMIFSLGRETSHSQVLNFVRGIRSRAIGDNREKSVRVEKNKLCFEEKERNICIKENIEKIVFPEGDCPKKIKFFPDGRISVYRIGFLLDEGKDFIILIEPVTGEIKVENYENS